MVDDDEDDFPEPLKNKMATFEESMGEMEELLKPFLKMPVADIYKTVSDPIQKAKLELMVAYTTNSLFWAYLITQGVDPKTHPIKDELLRIKGYIERLKAIEEKKKMVRVDTAAAKRIVRNAMWEKPASTASVEVNETKEVNTVNSHKKRKKDNNNEETPKKRKKKKKKT